MPAFDWTSFAKQASLTPSIIEDRGKGVGDEKDLVNHLFAKATAMLEDAIEIAVAGQAAQRSTGNLSDLARRLERAAGDIVTIAEAAGIAVGGGRDRPAEVQDHTP